VRKKETTGARTAGRRARQKKARPNDADEAQGSAKTVHLAFDILEYLVYSSSEAGVSDVAERFSTTKARAFRLLQTLVERGYLVQDERSARYSPSIRLFALGQAAGSRFDLAAAMRPEAQQLWDAFGHTVVTATLFNGKVLILDVLRGRTPVSLGLRVGASLDLHGSAQGRVALAFSRSDLIRDFLSAPLLRHTPKTLVNPTRLLKEINEIRRRGWAVTVDQLVMGMTALAAPVFDHSGGLAGTIAITGMTQFIPDPPPTQMVEELTSASWRASRKLGWSGTINPI